jgi:hypothetical protein
MRHEASAFAQSYAAKRFEADMEREIEGNSGS